MLEWQEEYYFGDPDTNALREAIEEHVEQLLKDYFENLDKES